MRTPDWQRLALIAVCASAAVFLGWCLWLLIGILAPVLGLFFGGWLLGCLQEPLVRWVACRTGRSRATAVAVTILVVCLVLMLVGVLAAPALGRDVSSSITKLPALVDAAAQRAVAFQDVANDWFAQYGLPIHLDVASRPVLDRLVQQIMGTSADPTLVVGGALQAVGSLGTMLLLSVFFLLGGAQLAEEVTATFGGRARSEVQFVLSTVHDSFEGFARGQLLQSALFGAGVWACLGAAGVDVAPLAAVLAGIMLLVPVVGAVIAIAVPVLATVLWNPAAAPAIAVVLLLLEQIVLNVVGPRLMTRQTGLPPLLVLFGILAGGQVAGFWGAVFGIPVLATLVTCLGHFRARWAS